MRQLLLTLQDELREKLKTPIWKRHIVLPEVNNKIHVITGMRRSGKSFYLLGLIHELQNKGIEPQRLLYINFEDDRLLPLSQQTFGELVDTFYQLYPENHDMTCYLFFDEIQNVEGWPMVIRRVFDSKKVRIFLSGSSAKMLSKEIATSLRGRSMQTEMWPLDFFEFPGRTVYPAEMPRRQLDQFLKEFYQYMQAGGFPELVHCDPASRVMILQNYVDVVIFRDIVERHHITNIALIRYILKTVLHSLARPLSVNKLFNDIKSQGMKVGKTTLYDYLTYIEDCYLAFSVPIYSPSLRVVQANPKKMYAIDTGLINAFTLNTGDFGHLFENIVFLTLRRRGYQIFYYLTQERYEVDFLVKDLSGKMRLYQACFQLKDAKTREREERALTQAQKELNVEGEIVTPENFVQFVKNLN